MLSAWAKCAVRGNVKRFRHLALLCHLGDGGVWFFVYFYQGIVEYYLLPFCSSAVVLSHLRVQLRVLGILKLSIRILLSSCSVMENTELLLL